MGPEEVLERDAGLRQGQPLLQHVESAPGRGGWRMSLASLFHFPTDFPKQRKRPMGDFLPWADPLLRHVSLVLLGGGGHTQTQRSL